MSIPQKTLEEALKAHLSGELSTAKILYQKAIRDGTNNPAAHANLAYILKEEGLLNEAMQEARKALAISPKNALFLANASGILLDLHEYKSAISLGMKALEAEPLNPIALTNLGSAYHELGNFQNAVFFCKKSLAIQPRNYTAITTIGFAHLAQKNAEEAFCCAQEAIKIEPLFAKAHLLKGNAQQALGARKSAKESYYQALKISKKTTDALLGLSNDINTSEEAQELVKLAHKTRNQKLDKYEQISFNYALSNCYHKLKKYHLAQRRLEKALRSHSDIFPSDARTTIQLIKQHLNNSYNRTCQENADKKEGRIFIVGMPRSGSTLLETVLSMSPQVYSLGESPALGFAVHSFMKQLSDKTATQPTLENLYSSNLSTKTTINHKYTVDKQLSNYIYTRLILTEIPNSKVIHCRRHPLDNLLSMLRSYLGNGFSFTASVNDSTEVLLEQEKAMTKYKEDFTDKIFTFNYDSFTLSPKETIKPLIDWLSLEWDDNFLRQEESDHAIYTSSLIQARQPININSLGNWKNYIQLLRPAINSIKHSGLFSDFELST